MYFSLKLHGKSGYYCKYNTVIIKSDGKTASSEKLLDHNEFHNLTKEPTKNFATYQPTDRVEIINFYKLDFSRSKCLNKDARVKTTSLAGRIKV